MFLVIALEGEMIMFTLRFKLLSLFAVGLVTFRPVAQPTSPASSAGCVPVPGDQLVEHTISYPDISSFLADLELVRDGFGPPTSDGSAALPAPQSEAEAWRVLIFGKEHDSEEMTPSSCRDLLQYYLVVWKPRQSNCTTGARDLMFGIKGFKRSSATDTACNGSSGNWFEGFDAPATRSFPVQILQRLQ